MVVYVLLLTYEQLFLLTKAHNDSASQPISGFDMEKVMTTLKQFVRDWSDEVCNSSVK